MLKSVPVEFNHGDATISGTVGLPLDATKAKLPSATGGPSDDFSTSLGRIAMLWAGFEGDMLQIVQAVARANGSALEHPVPPHLSFGRKKTRLRKELPLAFAAMPTARSYAEKIMNDAAQLQRSRNCLFHGFLSQRIRVEGEIPSALAGVVHGSLLVEEQLVAKAWFNGEWVEMTFTTDTIDDLYHEIAHVGGRLQELILLRIPIPEISPPDRLALQAFWNSNLPPHPTD